MNWVGFDCIVVGGYGKGFGYMVFKKGEWLLFLKFDGYVWNVVRVDGGYWKFFDVCWGVGYLDMSNNIYK